MKNKRLVISDLGHRDKVLKFLSGSKSLNKKEIKIILNNARFEPVDYRKSIGELLLTSEEYEKLRNQL